MSEIDPYEEDQASSHSGSLNSQEDWDLESAERSTSDSATSISSLTRPSGLATESTTTKTTSSKKQKIPKKKPKKKRESKRRLYVPIDSGEVIYGHFKNYGDKQEEIKCTCLSSSTRDANLLIRKSTHSKWYSHCTDHSDCGAFRDLVESWSATAHITQPNHSTGAARCKSGAGIARYCNYG